ncbi:MAG: disulfide bond formation protein DsbA [Actinobacteria bacterium]|nr:disulfide bond formation protein DsbA [Actinomycetota bacterium]
MPTDERLTKQQRREAAREQARKLREEQERREKRNRLIVIVGVVVGLVAVAALVWAIVSSSGRSALDDVARPAGSDAAGGIPVGSSLEAGTTNEGAPEVSVYLDYTCSYCGQFEAVNAADLETLAAGGEATVRFHPVAILDGSDGAYTDFSGQAVNAAATVAEYAPAQFLDFHTELFTLWDAAVQEAVDAGASAVEEPTVADIQATAAAVGVPQDVVERIPDGEFADWVAATTRQFGRDGFQGTPTVLVDGEEFLGWPEAGALADEVRGTAD